MASNSSKARSRGSINKQIVKCAELGCRRGLGEGSVDGFCILHVKDNNKPVALNVKQLDATYEIAPSLAQEGQKTCVVKGCNNSVLLRLNFCAIHESSATSRYQHTLETKKQRSSSSSSSRAASSSHLPQSKARCRFPDCVNKAVRGGERGYCRTHGGGKRCHYGGCSKSAKEGGFCIAHGGGKRCIHSRCLKGAKAGEFCITHSHLSDDKKAEIIHNAGNAEAKRANKVVLAEERWLKLKRQKQQREEHEEKRQKSATSQVKNFGSGVASPRLAGFVTPPLSLKTGVRRESPNSEMSSETITTLLGAANTVGGYERYSHSKSKRLRSSALFDSPNPPVITAEEDSVNKDVASMLLSLTGK